LYLETMKTTFNRLRSTWALLAMAVLVTAAPAASDADPQPTCKAMCQRFTDCKLSSFTNKCMEYCKQEGYESSEEGRAQLLMGMRASCPQIQQISSAVQSALDQRQRSSTRNPPPRAPTRSGSYDDAVDDAPVRRPAAGRSSHSGDNCAPVCSRFEQCRLWNYDRCIGFCSANTTDPAKNLSAAQWSCPKLEAWMQQLGVSGSSSRGGVTCTAEASVGTTQGNYPTIYRTITAMGNGPNRDAASVKALKDCGALVSTALNLAWLSGEQTEGGNCAISRCTQ
jgi:hypothetical protein